MKTMKKRLFYMAAMVLVSIKVSKIRGGISDVFWMKPCLESRAKTVRI